MEPALWRVASLVGAGWAVALGCLLLSARHLGRIRRATSPGAESLVRRLEADAAAGVDPGLGLTDVLEVAADAERVFGTALLVPRALSRVALASGTALSLLALTERVGAGGMSFAVGALLTFAAGLSGSLGCAEVGRKARDAVREARGAWRRDLNAASRAFGVTVEWTERRRARYGGDIGNGAARPAVGLRSEAKRR